MVGFDFNFMIYMIMMMEIFEYFDLSINMKSGIGKIGKDKIYF